METNRFLLKVSRLLPSSLTSCRFRTIPDVAENSITVSDETIQSSHENDLSYSHKNTGEKHSMKNLNMAPKYRQRCRFLGNSSDIKGRKYPPVVTVPNLNRKQRFQECKKGTNISSPSNNSGWFSSGDENSRPSNTSNSGDSFGLKAISQLRITKKCEEMKIIDEIERCSFSSLTSNCTIVAKKIKDQKSINTCPDYDIGLDQISTQIYYSKGMKTSRNGRKIKKKKKKKNSTMEMIEECRAVEKRSRDPRGDFRASMVEMMIEKQRFGAEDLERLLSCFLSLNSPSYHGIIVDVFDEICHTLFSY